MTDAEEGSDKTALVFVDNGYLRLVAKRFGLSSRYGLHKLADVLCTKAGLKCAKIFFYTAPPFQGSKPSDDEKHRKANYDRFVDRLKSDPTITIREGRCQKIGNEYFQKGVDTLMTMDLVGAKGHYPDVHSVVVITSDTDFVPVLRAIREDGIKVVLCYYNDYIRHSRFSMSNHLLTVCDRSILLSPEQFKEAERD